MEQQAPQMTKEQEAIVNGLEEKYADVIKGLDEIPEDQKNFQIASILRNVVAMNIAPLQGTPEVFSVFMDLFALDLTHMGYTLTKVETPEVESTDTNEGA